MYCDVASLRPGVFLPLRAPQGPQCWICALLREAKRYAIESKGFIKVYFSARFGTFFEKCRIQYSKRMEGSRRIFKPIIHILTALWIDIILELLEMRV